MGYELLLEATGGTSLQGYMNATFDELIEEFGAPTYDEPSGDGKVDVEWCLRFDDGTLATIYNWKDYDGGARCKSGESYRWHIGGKSFNAVSHVIDLFSESDVISLLALSTLGKLANQKGV